MTWVAVATAGAGLLGSFMNNKSGKGAAANSAKMAAADRAFQEKMYNQSLSDNRPDQTTDYGKLSWARDPTTGKWSQTNKMAAPEAARLEDFRQMAADRMKAANGGYKMDWNKLGFGHMAEATGVGHGDTGQAPWMNQKYSSSANDFLRNSQAPPSMSTQMGLTPGGGGEPGTYNYGGAPRKQPDAYGPTTDSPPSGGGSMLQPPQHAEIAPGYVPGQQFGAPKPQTTPGQETIDPRLMASVLRQPPQEPPQYSDNSGSGSV